jgi:hypothetical protein
MFLSGNIHKSFKVLYLLKGKDLFGVLKCKIYSSVVAYAFLRGLSVVTFMVTIKYLATR